MINYILVGLRIENDQLKGMLINILLLKNICKMTELNLMNRNV